MSNIAICCLFGVLTQNSIVIFPSTLQSAWDWIKHPQLPLSTQAAKWKQHVSRASAAASVLRLCQHRMCSGTVLPVGYSRFGSTPRCTEIHNHCICTWKVGENRLGQKWMVWASTRPVLIKIEACLFPYRLFPVDLHKNLAQTPPV